MNKDNNFRLAVNDAIDDMNFNELIGKKGFFTSLERRKPRTESESILICLFSAYNNRLIIQ